jgi:zinc protease
VVPLGSLGGERHEVLPDDVRLPRAYMGFRAPAYGRREWYVADLLAAVLSGGKSSVLYRDLVYDRQMVQEIGSYIDPTETAALFVLIASARPGVAVEAVEQALIEHLERAAAEPPSDEDFGRARNKVLTDYWSGLQKLDNRADLFSQFATYFDDPGRIAREVDHYRTIEPRELQQFAARYLTADERVRVTVVPRSAS